MLNTSKSSSQCHSAASQNEKSFGQKSSLYREFLAERDEILRHKWIESEKAGQDIGFERALLDWIRHYREGWRQARRNAEFSALSVGESNQGNQ